ncbi:MAG: hypothetical protein H7Z42_07935 [Roseiflexaceae bacterium]|nr:hypothetical protein [Roseiflexaceae bacterium]
MYDQRPGQPRTDTTRHLDHSEVKNGAPEGEGYYEGARNRTAKFAKSSEQLREIRAEINTLGREAHNRPTGLLSGGDVDIAYYYLGIGLGVAATFYSVIGTVFALNGGSTAVFNQVLSQWAAGPATALTEALLNFRTLGAIVLQVILFIVIVGTRRHRQGWQHWAALLTSAALTYAGWSSVLLAFGTAPLAVLTAAIPAALIGGALAWLIVKATSDISLPRWLWVGVVITGIGAGMLGDTALIHWIGALLAWSADQIARRIMVLG